VLNADCDEGAEKIIGSHILFAVGRKPNTDGLGLDKAGVETDERSETQGFMKVLVDADIKRILGANILGIGDDEVIHSLLVNMYADAAYTVIQRAVHIHPTVSELIPKMLGDLKPLE
jgi:pyruvate/2-oxoglutarate dehydrogenase complex dihydrolipoamide dehydrogenase (E3) component